VLIYPKDLAHQGSLKTKPKSIIPYQSGKLMSENLAYPSGIIGELKHGLLGVVILVLKGGVSVLNSTT